MSIHIEQGWKKVLKDQFDQDYFKHISERLRSDIQSGKVLYPPGASIFAAFDKTPWDRVKVIILGQDPYHGPGEAMGLCFSVNRGIKIPPSLRNIYKELSIDLDIQVPGHGDLSEWSEQGVFLLNSVLTVEHKSPGSHKDYGWQKFTDSVISRLSEQKEHLVFILWGRYAQSKKDLISAGKHLILESAHPSPFTGNKFFHNHHFSRANEYLRQHDKQEINWQLSLI